MVTMVTMATFEIIASQLAYRQLARSGKGSETRTVKRQKSSTTW
jgi:hypothetical protein